MRLSHVSELRVANVRVKVLAISLFIHFYGFFMLFLRFLILCSEQIIIVIKFFGVVIITKFTVICIFLIFDAFWRILEKFGGFWRRKWINYVCGFSNALLVNWYQL